MTSWQNWVVSRMVCNQIKKPIERESFDPIATRLYTKECKMPPPVELPPDWHIVPADGVNGDGLTGEWTEPADPNLHDDAPVVFYLHDSGYFFYSPRTHRPITIGLITHVQARVCILDYRLASEHPFPAPARDALSMYRMLVMQGVSPSRAVVAGGSAGGGLVLMLLVALRDAAGLLSVGVALYSPWTGLAATGQSLIDNDESDVIFRDVWVTYGAALYLGDPGAPANYPPASPLYANFMGLPTLYCYVNTNEVLRGDTLQMAEWARATGVSVSVEMGRRLSHAWPIFYSFFPEAYAALKRSGGQIRQLVTVQHKNRESVELTPV